MPIIQNTKVRLDVDGMPIDCHDGCLRFFDGRFYHYGTAYGNTDGFGFTNRYVVYSSADLVNWRFERELLQEPHPGVYYRPYVVFNPRTRKYVLWFNWYKTLWNGQFASAVSDLPTGPFTVINDDIQLGFPKPGDHNLFVDDDGAGYVIYTSIVGDGSDRHMMSVERLTDDFTGSTKQSSGVIDTKVEAPAMIKHHGAYYAVFGQTCCFCPEGADARVFVGPTPLGPFKKLGDINRDERGIIIPGQQTDIATIPTKAGPKHLWMCDLWGSRADGIKGHDLQYWSAPLEFDNEGNIKKLTWTDAFEIEL